MRNAPARGNDSDDARFTCCAGTPRDRAGDGHAAPGERTAGRRTSRPGADDDDGNGRRINSDHRSIPERIARFNAERAS
jgi:hypothetical protein